MVTLETFMKVIQVNRNDDRPWMVSSPVCNLLNQYKIVHCGLTQTVNPNDVARTPLAGPVFLACLDGRGRVRIGTNWIELEAGQACLQGVVKGQRLSQYNDESWTICWVAYQENTKTIPSNLLSTLIQEEFTADPLRCAIEGLHAEASTQQRLAAMQGWVDLIQSYVRLFTQPFLNNDRLHGMWTTIQSDLKEPWTIDRMAGMVGLSREHLRRVALESLGRSPMQHVTFLRMKKAADILQDTDVSIAEVAEEVGYSTANAFSDVFLRVTGLRPSAYRERLRRITTKVAV
jgi:AraC-like DNA-binding protein